MLHKTNAWKTIREITAKNRMKIKLNELRSRLTSYFKYILIGWNSNYQITLISLNKSMWDYFSVTINVTWNPEDKIANCISVKFSHIFSRKHGLSHKSTDRHLHTKQLKERLSHLSWEKDDTAPEWIWMSWSFVNRTGMKMNESVEDQRESRHKCEAFQLVDSFIRFVITIHLSLWNTIL